MSRFECDGCGLAACDLPDGVDPELIFERDRPGGPMLCQACQPFDSPPDDALTERQCEHVWTDWEDIGTCEMRQCLDCGAEEER